MVSRRMLKGPSTHSPRETQSVLPVTTTLTPMTTAAPRMPAMARGLRRFSNSFCFLAQKPTYRYGTMTMPCAMQKGASHTREMPQPKSMVPSTAQCMYCSGKIFKITSRMIHPSISASRYHMGPQEKNSCPK